MTSCGPGKPPSGQRRTQTTRVSRAPLSSCWVCDRPTRRSGRLEDDHGASLADDLLSHLLAFHHRLPLACIQNESPRVSVIRRNGPLDRIRVGIEQEHKRVVDDALAMLITPRNCSPTRKDAERTCMPFLPILIGHPLSIGLQPTNVVGAPNRPALEPAPWAKDGVLAAKGNEPARVGQKRFVDLG